MSKIKYPNYTYRMRQKILHSGTSPVTLDNARSLMGDHHFVLAWDGDGEPEENGTYATLAILTSVHVTADKIQYGVHTCDSDYDLKYDNAVFIHNDSCPEVLVKSEGGAFVGHLIGIDTERGMAVVRVGGAIACYSISIVTYVDDVNGNMLGLRKEEASASEGDTNG